MLSKTGGRPRTDYLLTVDMAKELAMVERIGPNGTDLRTIEIEGALWFVAADVCDCLSLSCGSSQGGTTRLLYNLDASEKQLVSRAMGSKGNPAAVWPNRGAICISESGLYKLIMRSDKATARPFQDWVTKVVLPSIRNTGGIALGLAQRLVGRLHANLAV